VADEETVKRLKQGVAVWNVWRKAHPDAAAELRGANLSNADLSNANLSRANLTNADLSRANLPYSNLSSAKLNRAFLSAAHLSGANLSDADLSRATLNNANYLSAANLNNANLSGADLRGANLCGTNLSSANLSGANLSDAFLLETIFSNVDLSGVIGLETCVHIGPSTIDHRTLQKSRALPLAFLRGVGLPDNLIDYLPSFFNRAIQLYSCFISYSAKDQEFAERLHADLQNKGVRCWFAPHDMPIGAKILDALDEAIKLRDKLLLILSENSIESDWVEDEVQKAFAEERDRKELVLFPIRIDDAVMETPEPWARKLRDQRNVGDFRRWKDHDAYKQSFERVVRDLTVPPAK
jgi:hypothetical protein